MLIKHAGPRRALSAVLHRQKADGPKALHIRRDAGLLTESARTSEGHVCLLRSFLLDSELPMHLSSSRISTG